MPRERFVMKAYVGEDGAEEEEELTEEFGAVTGQSIPVSVL